jgi:hypothetical protein
MTCFYYNIFKDNFNETHVIMINEGLKAFATTQGLVKKGNFSYPHQPHSSFYVFLSKILYDFLGRHYRVLKLLVLSFLRHLFEKITKVIKKGCIGQNLQMILVMSYRNRTHSCTLKVKKKKAFCFFFLLM